MKKVAVLCRGESLKYLSSLPEIDEYIIVNNWAVELNQKFIIDRFLDNKPITHISNLATLKSAYHVTTHFDEMRKHYKNFNIQKIVLPYVEECVSDADKNLLVDFDIEGRNGIILVESLPDKVKPFLWKRGETDALDASVGFQVCKYKFDLPSTGVAGLVYAVVVMDASEIYICGMDFYEAPYAFGTEIETAILWGGNGRISGETIPMKTFLTENIINRFPNKKFYINTYGNYNLSGDNVVVNNLNKKKIAVVATGWYFPLHFYEQIKNQKIPSGWEVDLFCVSHRNPNLEIVRTEKNEYISSLGDSILNRMDKLLYSKIATIEEIKSLGWNYIEEPNTMGDWGIFNQWLEKNNYEDYDVILSTHDDNFIFGDNLFSEVMLQLFDWDDWLVIVNGPNPGSVIEDYGGRASFDFFKKEMLEMIGGKFDISKATLTRVGKVDTPKEHTGISDWNYTPAYFNEFIKNNNLTNKVKRLSDTYRISTFCFEGERGFLSKGGGDIIPPIINFINDNFNIEEI